jgi:thioredoxin 1
MAEPTPNPPDPNQPVPPPGAAPAKSPEAAKVQPKKETVRIALPPKPTAAPTIKLPSLPPTSAASAGAAPATAAPGARPGTAAAPTSQIPRPAPATAAAPAAAPTATKPGTAVARPAPAPAPAKAPPAAKAPAGARTISAVDTVLAVIAMIVGIAAVLSVLSLMMGPFKLDTLQKKKKGSMASENIVTLTEENFSDQVLKSPTPILVDFWAEWCGPCKMIAPVLDELAAEYDGKVKIGKVNIDEHQQIAINYGINSIPTLLFFKNGQVADQVVGMRSKRDLKASFDRVLA